MTLLLGSRVGQYQDLVGDIDPTYEPIKKKVPASTLRRIRVKKRRLKELRGELVDSPDIVEIDELPKSIAKDLTTFPTDTSASLLKALENSLVVELSKILSALETAQIEEARMIELWNKIYEEELITLTLILSDDF